jgi:tetratricopeptide (TPR) repeat protein
MPIKGSLREASLADVLQLLAMGRKTGCLSVADRSSFGYIHFDVGRVCHASLVNRGDRLGELLVKTGAVEPAVLAEAVEAQAARSGTRIGEILVERGAITRAQLEAYLRRQVEEAVYHLFAWTQGTFHFESGQRPDEGSMLVSIPPETLLLEGARRVDEWTLIEKRIPSLDLVFSVHRSAAGPATPDLTPDQARVLALLDGRRSVREVVEDSGLVEFTAAKALFGLAEAGLVRPVGRKPTEAPAESSPTRIQEHWNLGVAFYRTRRFEDAAREFLAVAELEPGSLRARHYLGLLALRLGRDRAAVRQFRDLVEAGGDGASTFHHLALALERLGRLDQAMLAAEEALRRGPGVTGFVLSLAILLFKTGRPAEAAAAFERYRRLLGPRSRPPAAFYAFAVLAEAGRDRPDAALALGEEGLAAHPDHAVLLLHLAAVRERMGAVEPAEALYRRAAEEDPQLPQAQKSLGDVLYRRGRYEEAATAYERAIALAPDLGADVHFRLGNIRYKHQNRERALEHWRRALEIDPGHAIARTNLELVEGVLKHTELSPAPGRAGNGRSHP